MISILLAVMVVQQQLPPLVVTGTRPNPLPSDTIDRTHLRRDVRPSLAAVASDVPGVRAVTTGAIITKPVIRGLSGARILTIDNGNRVEDFSWSDEDGPSLDPRLAERVEVIRGPASLLYGSDAIGGVVNSIPEAIPEAAPGERVRNLGTELFGSSNNPGVGAGVEGEWARNNFGARLNLVGHFAGNTQTPPCELENTGFSALNGEAALGIHHGDSRAALRIARFGGEFRLLEAGGPGFTAPPGCPGGPPKPAADTGGGPERKVDDLRVQLGGESHWHGLRLEGRAQFETHNTIENSDDVTPGVEVETINLGLNTETADLLAHFHSGTVGISGMHQDYSTSGVAPLIPAGTLNNIAIFAIERIPVGRVSFLAGIRGDLRRLHADSNATLALGAQDRNANSVTGDVGMVLDMGQGISLTGNVGRAFRAPNFFELFANGPRLGEDRYEVGDPTLKPEVSLNIDASLRWQRPRFRGEIAAYRNRIQDFIYIVPAGQLHSPDSLPIYDYQHGQATLTGGEASATFDLSPKVTAWVRGDAVRGQNDTQDQPLPLMPPLRATVGARWHIARWYAGANAEALGKQDRLGPGDTATASYVLIGLEGGHTLRMGGRLLTIDARIRNLANQSYRDFLSRYKRFAFNPGRSIEVRFATEF